MLLAKLLAKQFNNSLHFSMSGHTLINKFQCSFLATFIFFGKLLVNADCDSFVSNLVVISLVENNSFQFFEFV